MTEHIRDDDVDMFMDFHKKKDFLDLCNSFGSNLPILMNPIRVELHCSC